MRGQIPVCVFNKLADFSDGTLQVKDDTEKHLFKSFKQLSSFVEKKRNDVLRNWAGGCVITHIDGSVIEEIGDLTDSDFDSVENKIIKELS